MRTNQLIKHASFEQQNHTHFLLYRNLQRTLAQDPRTVKAGICHPSSHTWPQHKTHPKSTRKRTGTSTSLPDRPPKLPHLPARPVQRIHIPRTQQRQIAVPHLQLQRRQIAVIRRMITRKRMAQHIRWPAPETNLTPQRTPAALPVTGNRQKPAPLKQPTDPPATAPSSPPSATWRTEPRAHGTAPH